MSLRISSKTTFWGNGADELFHLVRDRSSGNLFERIFGFESDHADEDEKFAWVKKYCAFPVYNCYFRVVQNDDGSFSLLMRSYPDLPYGVFEKISSRFPEIHADGLFIHEDECFMGAYLIENGEFHMTMLQNPKGRCFGEWQRFNEFFTSDYNAIEDVVHKNILRLLKLEKDLLRGETSAKEEMEILLDSFSDEDDSSPEEGTFFLSKLEKQSFIGDSEAQFKLGSWMNDASEDFILKNPNIFPRKQNGHHDFSIDMDYLGTYWKKKAALQGNRDCISSLLAYYKRKAFDDKQIEKWEKLVKTAESAIAFP